MGFPYFFFNVVDKKPEKRKKPAGLFKLYKTECRSISIFGISSCHNVKCQCSCFIAVCQALFFINMLFSSGSVDLHEYTEVTP